MAESDSFVLVKNKKKGRRYGLHKASQSIRNSLTGTECQGNDTDINHDGLKRKISSFGVQLKSSEFYTDVIGQVKECYSDIFQVRDGDKSQGKVDSCEDTVQDTLARMSLDDKSALDGDFPSQRLDGVCYGVGHIASCITAQYQLALCVALREDLGSVLHCFSFYDPVFTTGERKLLEDLGFDVIQVNEEGRRECRVPTLFFLPHCGKALYNNLLWRNWSPDNLCNIIIIGNSFSAMIERTPARILQKTGSYILKIHPYTAESPLSVSFQPGDVFNDLSIHYFPKDKLSSVPCETWESCDEPVYSDTDAEIIQNS